MSTGGSGDDETTPFLSGFFDEDEEESLPMTEPSAVGYHKVGSNPVNSRQSPQDSGVVAPANAMWTGGSGDDESAPLLSGFFDENEEESPPETVPLAVVKAGVRQLGSATFESRQPARDAGLMAAIKGGDFRRAESMLRRGGSLLLDGAGLPLVNCQLLLHNAVRAKRQHCLQHLLEATENVNAVDSAGKTALFVAVELGWVEGVRLLLNARADVRTRYQANNKTVLQMAVNTKNQNLTQLIVDAARGYDEHEYEQIINIRNDDGLSPLFVAVQKGNVEIVEILLAARADVTLRDIKGRNVAHVVGKNSERILSAIGKRHANKMKHLIGQRCDDWLKPTPLHSAISRGDVAAVQHFAGKFPECLDAETYVNGRGACIVEANVLHLVSESDRPAVLAYFVSALGKHPDAFRIAVDGTTSDGLTPLHFALVRRQVEFAVALIRAGADLSAEFKDETDESRSAVNVFVHQVPGSVEKLTRIFDESIEKSRCEVTVVVDYEVLCSGLAKDCSFKVLAALQDTGEKLGQDVLFEHPLVESYLHLHWKRIQGPYMVLVFFNAMFSLSLSLLVLFELLCFDFPAEIAMWSMLVCGVPLVMYELECIGKKQPLKYRFEFLMKCSCFVLAGFVLFYELSPHASPVTSTEGTEFPTFSNLSLPSASSQNTEFSKLSTHPTPPNSFHTKEFSSVSKLCCAPYSSLYYELSAFAVLLSWFELLLLVSRIPNTGFYMLLFLEVARKYLLLILSFFFLIFGFAVAFMAISRLESPFHDFVQSTMKTTVMLAGEYDYGTIGKALMKVNLPYQSEIAALTVITLFVIFMGLVLNNLFVAVAVIGVSKVRIISKRIEFLCFYSEFLQSKCCRLFPLGVMHLLFRLVCAFVRLFRPKTVRHWESFREIDRSFTIGVLLNDQRLKFPRELNTAIIARGYKNREALTKKYQEDEEALRIKKMFEAAAAERRNDREKLLGEMKEFEKRVEKEITGLKESLSEIFNFVQART